MDFTEKGTEVPETLGERGQKVTESCRGKHREQCPTACQNFPEWRKQVSFCSFIQAQGKSWENCRDRELKTLCLEKVKFIKSIPEILQGRVGS